MLISDVLRGVGVLSFCCVLHSTMESRTFTSGETASSQVMRRLVTLSVRILFTVDPS